MKNYIKRTFFLIIFLFFIGELILALPIMNKDINAAVVVKKDEIWAVNINDTKEKALLKEGENYKFPLISMKGYVAFKNENNDLFVVKINFKNNEESFKVSDKVASYAWDNEGNLLFSKYTGGLYLFDVNNKSVNDIKAEKEYYLQLALGKDNTVYGLKNEGMTDENSYPMPLGIVELDLNTKKENMIVPYKPASLENDGLGLNPAIAAISKDGTKLIIWLRPNSASITADGVPIGIYDSVTKEFKEIKNENIIVLTYNDMIDVSPKENNLIALINGSSRFMNLNKTLGVLNVENNNFIKITKENEAAMTPSFSEDGNKIIYSSSPSMEEMQEWEASNNQNIYEVNLENNEIIKLTNSKDGFDFWPKYLSDKEFTFIRKDRNNKFSLMKGNKEGKEEIIIDEIISPKDAALEADFWYYGHYNMNKIFDFMAIKGDN
ncbi:hypothetical protein [Clostridium isatidis]|uniref:hypothetical protein n=1 Tax=Clostridium isatidis TaxID=182773 RepID=UPI003AAA9B29